MICKRLKNNRIAKSYAMSDVLTKILATPAAKRRQVQQIQ
jgi:hypothetical protein